MPETEITIAASTLLTPLAPDLAVMQTNARAVFTHLIKVADRTTTVMELARQLKVTPSTFMSRFFRAALPSPKAYLIHARLMHAAFLLQSDAYSIADVAHRLEYSSPQAFSRHLGSLLGLTAGEFRRRMPLSVIVPRYRATYLTPYLDRLARFEPFPWPSFNTSSPGLDR